MWVVAYFRYKGVLCYVWLLLHSCLLFIVNWDTEFSKDLLINLEPNVPQDFLYLSGILEPDSALVLYGKGRPDQAILFVPRRDPGRELWDGPRSGKDGAAALTGIERVHSTEELGVVLKSLKGGWMGVWGHMLSRNSSSQNIIWFLSMNKMSCCFIWAVCEALHLLDTVAKPVNLSTSL